MSVHVIAEIGINHNGDINLAKKLIDVASIAGCDSVKFQKRNPDVCVPENQKSLMKETPWGKMSYLDYKYKIEFGKVEYDEIDLYCKSKGIQWFASVWDEESIDFIGNYTGTIKVPSAHLNSDDILLKARTVAQFLMLSTGMSSEQQIEHAIKIGKPDLIFHTNSSYPTPVSELNLYYITWLIEKYSNLAVGYSGHEFGLVPTFAAVTLGATYIERHITLDRTLWGSDQMASVEPGGLMKMVKGIRDLEQSFGEKSQRIITKSEYAKLESLRGA
jgi:N-acetylneuraminate synthase